MTKIWGRSGTAEAYASIGRVKATAQGLIVICMNSLNIPTQDL